MEDTREWGVTRSIVVFRMNNNNLLLHLLGSILPIDVPHEEVLVQDARNDIALAYIWHDPTM